MAKSSIARKDRGSARVGINAFFPSADILTILALFGSRDQEAVVLMTLSDCMYTTASHLAGGIRSWLEMTGQGRG